MKSKTAPGKKVQTKRLATREKRRQQQRRQRLTVLLIIAGVAVVLLGLLAFQPLRNALSPVGDIVAATPRQHPQADGRAMGDPNAPVTVEVFEDFQCPACQGFSMSIEPQVVEKYVPSGQIYYIYRLFPFLDDQSVTKESDRAAQASLCAADQGRFWDYHDLVFANWNGENAGAFRDRRLQAFAEKLGLDMTAFNRCFADNSHQDVIDADIARGRELGVTGTPTVFVNGQVVGDGRNVPNADAIGLAIEAELAK
jgi:protein-disulfide isomerase